MMRIIKEILSDNRVGVRSALIGGTIGGTSLIIIALGSFLNSLIGVPALLTKLKEKDEKLTEQEKLIAPLRQIGLERYAGSEKEAMLKLSEYIAELQKRDEKISAELETLRQKMEPRGFSQEQKETFINSLKDSPKGLVKMMRTSRAAETVNYANQINKLIAESGFETGQVQSVIGYSFNFSFDTSVVLMSGDSEHAPSYLTNILSAFEEVGINAIVWYPPPNSKASVPLGELTIFVNDRL